MRKILFPLVLVLLIIGCAGMQMGPEDILYKAESLYIAQHIDYMNHFVYVNDGYTLKPGITEEKKEILRARKDALEEFELTIKTYRAFVRAGDPPSYEAEQQMIFFIRQFGGGY